PDLARKARIEGPVWMEVTVDEKGRVVCTRTNGLPFGITAAAEKAMRQWRFEPYILDGKAVAVTSEIAWHFRRVPQEEWKEIAAGF
ncbi:MAG TPA: energy transducer TonB, partial [Thermoanaerobaculia bacterium]|nr:energy transducer TonB [Thermoanaerobaculia bacterium]